MLTFGGFLDDFDVISCAGVGADVVDEVRHSDSILAAGGEDFASIRAAVTAEFGRSEWVRRQLDSLDESGREWAEPDDYATAVLPSTSSRGAMIAAKRAATSGPLGVRASCIHGHGRVEWRFGQCSTCANESQARSQRRYPEKTRARQKLNDEVRAGRVVRMPCERCGEANGEGHHDDYSKPLDVRWLCRRHHEAVHHSLEADPPRWFTRKKVA